ncbi:MAG: hypothetical protein HYV27_02390 [Candidatus Hydrogenedentes bacterium]|nr:hypothetical protein [Candidatus Hydrogenedentota bacterium]
MELRTTGRFGTPCSPAWDDAWIETVKETERCQGRSICGARTMSGKPCTLDPNHKNGRCKFHGGFNCTGAQPGNRNAVLHGLYSRGIQRCGRHCPMWSHCPLASEEVDKLPLNNRPQCPYEVAQFQMAETDLAHHVRADADCVERHTIMQTALVQTMVLRAATAMTVSGPVENTTMTMGDKTVVSTKPSAALTAFLKLSSEHRRYLALLQPGVQYALSYEEELQRTDRLRNDSEVLPEAKALLHPAASPGKEASQKYVNAAAESVQHARKFHQEITATEQKARARKQSAAAAPGGSADATVPPSPVRAGLETLLLSGEAQLKLENLREKHQIHLGNARFYYARAFGLYPAWREELQHDPAHDRYSPEWH